MTHYHPYLRNCCGLIAVFVAVCALAGCRSQAHQDLYTDHMSGEIRVLEDQLYEADYENKVLRNKLKRAVENCEPGQAKGVRPTPDPQADWGISDVLPPRRERPFKRSPSTDSGDASQGDSNDSDPPSPKPDSAPNATLLPPPGGLPGNGNGDDIDERRIETPGGSFSNPPSNALEPPDADSLTIPDIDMGDIIPPPGPDATPEPPLGQIPLPNMTPAELPQPAALLIHPAFSGGHNFDSDPEIDGVYLVIQFLDQHGKVLELGDMEIDADLSIELIDPNAEREQSHLGKWEFSAKEIAAMRRSTVQDGIHVALRWADTPPSGDKVNALVQVSNGETKLQGNGELKLVGKGQIAGWVPRADKAAKR